MPRIDRQELRRLRDRAELSQRALAREADVARATVQRLEGGQCVRPHPATLRLIAQALGCDASELVPEVAA